MMIQDLPLVIPLANFFWGEASDEVSAEICLGQIPMLSSQCFNQLLAKLLGIIIIAGSCINKVPLIRNMMKSQSAAGISRESLYSEAIVYGSGVFYGFLFEYPFSSYGENVSLLIQSFVLIAMTWSLSATPVSPKEKVFAFIGFASFSIGSLYILPDELRYLLMAGQWPVMIFSRGSQIFSTYLAKNIGNLSIITTSMNLVGALIRVGTTLQETGDAVIIAGYMLSFALNFVMFFQYFLYLKNAETKSKKD